MAPKKSMKIEESNVDESNQIIASDTVPKGKTKKTTVKESDDTDTVIPTKSKSKKSESESNDNEITIIPTKSKAKKTVSKTEKVEVQEADPTPTKGRTKKTVPKTDSKTDSKTNSKTDSKEEITETVKSKKKPISSKEKSGKTTKKELLKDNDSNDVDNSSNDSDNESNIKPVSKQDIEKPTKGGKKINNQNLGSSEKKINANDEENYKIWKKEWGIIVDKINEHQKVSHELEKERDELVKKMDSYFSARNGSIGENILESNSKLKKTITKFDVVIKPGDINDNSDTTDDSDDSDDSDDNSDDDSTPLQPLKTNNLPKFASSSSKKKIINSDSDDSN